MGLQSTRWRPSEGFWAGAEFRKSGDTVRTENSKNVLKWFAKVLLRYLNNSEGHPLMNIEAMFSVNWKD